AGEAVTRRRHGRGVGVPPGALRGSLRSPGVVVAVVVMSGLGRSLGGSSTDQESCGEKRERRVPAGGSRRYLLDSLHSVCPFRNSIATYVTSGTPVPS